LEPLGQTRETPIAHTLVRKGALRPIARQHRAASQQCAARDRPPSRRPPNARKRQRGFLTPLYFVYGSNMDRSAMAGRRLRAPNSARACRDYKNGPDFRPGRKSSGERLMRRLMVGTAARKYGAIDFRICVAALGVAVLSLVSSVVRAEISQVETRCEVFSTASDRAGCACALQHGGWVTQVRGKWRWIYPRRRQERHCATVTSH
jgi:hypothetical protein